MNISLPEEKDIEKMENLHSFTPFTSTTNIVYQGRPLVFSQGVAESSDEFLYRMMHSLTVSNDPQRVGRIDTFSAQGMQFSQDRGYSPNIQETMIIRKVIQESIFRQALLRYIQKYVDADDPTILRAIGRNNTDAIVAQHLSQLPRKTHIRGSDDRIQNRVHTVTNLLSRIPHIPIVNYLDYGTGDGSVAAAIAEALSVPERSIPNPSGGDPIVQPGRRISVQGVDVFPMQRPIPTRIVKDGDSLPAEWTNQFQLITAFVVLHHVKNQQHIISELYRVLAPGGILILREHDYRDMTPTSILRMQKMHVYESQGVTLQVDPLQEILGDTKSRIVLGEDPFRHFLDAVHIVSMALYGENMHSTALGQRRSKEPAFWSLYRARMEWHSLLQNAGFSHHCTVSAGFDDISSQMEKRIRICETASLRPQDGLATVDTPDTTGGDEEETPNIIPTEEGDTCDGWISRNPQRMYESAYTKPIPLNALPNTQLILEYKVQRNLAVEAFFPKKGGRTGDLPPLVAGVNYDNEVLSYMTPWFIAQQTSALISSLMRREYGEDIPVQPTTSNPNPPPRRRTPKFRLFDGTGGAGGNVLAFLSNRDVTNIQVYERVQKFFQYLVNNVQLYTDKQARPLTSAQNMGSTALTLTHTIAPPPLREGMTFRMQPFEQTVSMYNTEFPLYTLTAEISERGRQQRGPREIRTQMTDSVLFLDVPWVSEGCGYKLRGYTYAGETLENVATRVLRAGAYMVVFKLPPGYQLEMKHLVEELHKETLYIVYRRFLQPLAQNLQGQMVTPTIIRRPQATPVQPVPVRTTIPTPSIQPAPPRTTIPTGGNPAYELIRYRLMDHLRTQFRTIVSNKKDDYYMWVYERVRTFRTCVDNEGNCVLDPIIPATPTFQSSAMVTMEPFWPSMPFAQLSELIREEYPQLVTQLEQTFFLDEQAVMALRRALAGEISLRQRERVNQMMNEIDTLARNLHEIFLSSINAGDIAATVSIREPRQRRGDTVSIIITPNDILRGVLQDIDNQLGAIGTYPTCATQTSAFACMTILGSKLAALRGRYLGNAFEQHLGAMLLRYSMLMEPTKETSFSGVNLHAAIPPALFRMLGEKMGVTTECFASPLNATLRYFMSAFPDVDAPFGSIGSFFTYDFRYRGLPMIEGSPSNGPSGSYEANPPFTEDMIQNMINHMENLLTQADSAGTPLSFFIVIPDWQSPPANAIKASRWKKFEMIVPASQHRFIGGQQHISEGSFTATFDTYIAVLQSRVGVNTYPIPSGFSSLILTSFT